MRVKIGSNLYCVSPTGEIGDNLYCTRAFN